MTGPDPLALTEGDDETADGLPVLDQLEDGPLGGSHPPHHRALGRPEPSVKDVALGVELGEVAGVHRRLGLGRDRLSPVGPPGEAGHQAGAEQQRDRDHLGHRVDPQGVVGGGQEEVVGEGPSSRAQLDRVLPGDPATARSL